MNELKFKGDSIVVIPGYYSQTVVVFKPDEFECPIDYKRGRVILMDKNSQGQYVTYNQSAEVECSVVSISRTHNTAVVVMTLETL